MDTDNAPDLRGITGPETVTLGTKLMKAVPPKASSRHRPLAHADVFRHVSSGFRKEGYPFTNVVHSLQREGQRYHGFATIPGPSKHAIRVIGWRAAHDRRMGVSLFTGHAMPASASFCLHESMPVTSKTTARQNVPIEELVAGAVEQAIASMNASTSALTWMRKVELQPPADAQLFVTLLRKGVITPSRSLFAIGNWDTPESEEFLPRTAWSMFNAVTASYLGGNNVSITTALIERSIGLLPSIEEFYI